jgi:hypothetical protein
MVTSHGYPLGYRFHTSNMNRRIKDRVREVTGRGGRLAKNTAACKFYMKGKCKFGSKCKYVHEGAEGEVVGMDVDLEGLCEGVQKVRVSVPKNIRFGKKRGTGPRLKL